MNVEGTRFLVTGADGFIGSHLVERLAGDGAEVRALCCYNSKGSFGWLDGLAPDLRDRVELCLGDIRDARCVDNAVEGIDVVCHLAALVSIPYSYDAPGSFLDTNVTGTFHVLEAARRHRVARLVHASTSEVYGTPDRLPIVETDALKAQSPYSASKIAAEKLCEAWACTHGLPVTILRPFNTYGPRQSARAVIPTVLSQVLAGARQVRLGNVYPRRDFTYVTDTVEAFVRAGMTNLNAGEVVQLGTGRAISVGELVELIAKIEGVDLDIVGQTDRERPPRSEVDVLLSDPTKAAEVLGWKAAVDLDQGLAWTAAWLRSSGSVGDVGRYWK